MNRHILLLFILVNSIRESNEDNFLRVSRGAYAYSTNIEVRCFSSDSLVQLANGKGKYISDLHSGDQLLTLNKWLFVSTEMILMFHQSSSESTLFVTLETESNHRISLTLNHLIPIRKNRNQTLKYILTKDIQLNDQLLVLSNNQTRMTFSSIRKKIVERKLGYYAPLTMTGTLFVNGIYSSSFAHVRSHYFAQFSLFPLRFFYQFFPSFISFNFLHLLYFLSSFLPSHFFSFS